MPTSRRAADQVNGTRAGVLVLVPAYNEERNVGDVVKGLRAEGWDVLVVDDGSRDGTAAVARLAGADVVRLPRNLGVGGALRCGFHYAVDRGYDTVVQCDGDGQHPPELVAGLVTHARSHDLHLLVGSRFVTPSGYEVQGGRRAVMRFLGSVASRLTGVRLTDTTSGFRVICTPLLEEFSRSYPAQYLGDTFEALVGAGRAGYRVGELGVSMRERASGTSSATPGASVRYVLRAVLTVLIGTGKQVPPLAGGRPSGAV